MNSPQSHFFFAAEIPTEIKVQIAQLCQHFREEFPFEKWVHPEDYHITLAFLGSASSTMLEKAQLKVASMVKEEKAFSLTINSLGVFGNPESPRIFWAGVNRQPLLYQVQEKVFHACKQSGFPLETRPFSPHITLARKWQGLEEFSKDKLSMKATNIEISFTVKNIILYRTNLAALPKYEPFATFALTNE